MSTLQPPVQELPGEPRHDASEPPADDATDPLDERPEERTHHSPAYGPPAWTHQPDVPEPFDPPNGGHYEARTFHKLGGRGRVWRAWDSELKREVAFKEIRPKFANDPETLRRFTFEAEVTGRLDHPAVIPVYGFGRDAAGKPCYAMRFVEGKSLQEAIADFYAASGPDGAERALVLRRLLAQFVTVCRAVDYAHSKGVIHRDLKPANILVGDFGETLVVDWGAAKRLKAAPGGGAVPAAPAAPYAALEDPGFSRTGELIGTPAYWSPEQYAADPDKHDARTDVFGLGGVLFAILTGAHPNVGGVPAVVAPSARDRCPWVDAGIDAIARTALAFDPNARYQTAAAVAEAVELWLADQPLLAQRTVVAGLERAAKARPDDLALAEQLARQRSNLGLMLAGMGRDRDAVPELKAAAEVFARLAATNQPRFLADRAGVLMSLARSWEALDKKEMARALAQEAWDLCRKLVVEQPEVYPADLPEVMLSGSYTDIELPDADRLGVPPPVSRPAPTAEKLTDPDSEYKFDPPDGPESYSDLPPVPQPYAVDPSAIPPARPPRASSGSFDVIDLEGDIAALSDPDLIVLPPTPNAVDLPPADIVPNVPTIPMFFNTTSPDDIDLGPLDDKADPIPMAFAASSADFDLDELPRATAATDSVADVGTLAPPRGTGDSFVFELPSGVGSFAELPPLPVPPPEEKPAPRAKPVADSVPDIDSLFLLAPGGPPPAAPPRAFLALASGYTWLRDLARGGMSRLYLARDENLNRVVVIKTLADGEPTASRAARRFRREVQITGSLEHPNLIRAYASGTGADGRPYLVLEYLNGGTLVRQLDVYGPGWGPGLLDPLAQACDGLHVAHARSIVHRDAKLSNIMVLPAGRTVLLDWGLGKVVGQQDSLDSGGGPVEPPAEDPMRSRAGAIVGTPAYMSPEQARGEAGAIGPRTDVFTFGANLFHLVTGKPPGHGDDLRALIARRRTGDIPRLRAARPDVPKRLDEICSRAMAPRPENRYPTVAAFAADLRAFLAARE